jgi:hypothetical protein
MSRIGLALLLCLFVQSFVFVEESSTAQQNSPDAKAVQSNIRPDGDNPSTYMQDASRIVALNKETGKTDAIPSIAENHINAILKSIVVVIVGVIIILRLRMRKSRLSILNSALLHDKERTVEKQISHDNKKTACIKHGKWIVVGASVTGKSHLKSNPPEPCQDSHVVIEIEDDWGVAVVCDGAGSAKNSHRGAAFVAEKTANLLKNTVKKYKWSTRNWKGNYDKYPSYKDWHCMSQMVFDSVLKELEEYSRDIGTSIETMACTVISVIYSPVGILISHIGDGRAAYCDGSGEWKEMMVPFKGEEANQTIFITSPMAMKTIGPKVIKEDISAFALMSDGCEMHSFEVNIKKTDEEIYYDPNKPYYNFFNPIIDNLRCAYKSSSPDTEVAEKWKNFIESGTTGLVNEPDDKTMIIGVFSK